MSVRQMDDGTADHVPSDPRACRDVAPTLGRPHACEPSHTVPSESPSTPSVCQPYQ
jgi:hypothetical protein